MLTIGGLGSPVLAAGEQPCEVVPMPCTFESLPFTLKVVDAETRQPLAGVHALAEWEVIGPGGRGGGPLMVLDAVSAADGVLRFASWGPIQGPVTGLEIGHDPMLTLFKTGYRAVVINNAFPPGTKETLRVCRFGQDGRSYAVEPFRGTPEQWLHQLDKLRGLPRNDQQSLKFRAPYLNRLKRISAERDKIPSIQKYFEGSFFWHVDKAIKFLEDGHR